MARALCLHSKNDEKRRKTWRKLRKNPPNNGEKTPKFDEHPYFPAISPPQKGLFCVGRDHGECGRQQGGDVPEG